MHLRSHRRAVAACLLILATAFAHAQTLEIGGAGGTEAFGVSLALVGLREGDASADVGLAIARAADGRMDALLTVRARRSAAAGLLGAASADLAAAVTTRGELEAGIAGRGVIGPVSVRLEVAGATATPGAFDPSGIDSLDDRPRVRGPMAEIDASMRYRIDRDLLLDASAELFLTGAGPAFRGTGALRLRRLTNQVDGAAHAVVYAPPGAQQAMAAIGATAIFVPRRAPEWAATAWLGWSGMLSPGFAVHGASALGAGVRADVAAAAEPFRIDIPPYRGALGVTLPVGPGEGFARLQARAGSTGASDRAALGLVAGLRWPLSPP